MTPKLWLERGSRFESSDLQFPTSIVGKVTSCLMYEFVSLSLRGFKILGGHCLSNFTIDLNNFTFNYILIQVK